MRTAVAAYEQAVTGPLLSSPVRRIRAMVAISEWPSASAQLRMAAMAEAERALDELAALRENAEREVVLARFKEAANR